jgi:hypothetical protein
MVSPIDIQKSLSGIDFPASKQDIVAHAEQNGADKAVIDALKEIADREYEGPNGVSSAAFS